MAPWTLVLVVLIMDRRRRAGQIVDLVDFEIERKSHIVPDYFETMMIEHTLDVATCCGEIIINTNDASALLEQTFAKVRAEKSGSASDQDALSRCIESPPSKFNPSHWDRLSEQHFIVIIINRCGLPSVRPPA
jgi:hypothetical protein